LRVLKELEYVPHMFQWQLTPESMQGLKQALLQIWSIVLKEGESSTLSKYMNKTRSSLVLSALVAFHEHQQGLSLDAFK